MPFANRCQETGQCFSALKSITAAALKTLRAQREYSVYLAHRPRVHNVRDPDDFTEANFGGEPASLRASALPSTQSLVETTWNTLLPQAVQKAGGKTVRAWLQGLSTPTNPLHKIAASRLSQITTLLAANLRRDAQKALVAKQYDRAKVLLLQLNKEYSDDAAIASFTKAGFSQVTQGYKDLGDSAFDMRILQPQTAALSNYKKLLANADSPALKGYAQFRMADALGTMAKYKEGIALLRQSIATWNAIPANERPKRPANENAPHKFFGPENEYYIEDAYYYLGYYLSAGLKQRDAGIAAHRDFLKKFPNSKQAPEVLHDIMLWYRWSNRPKEAAAAAKDLVARFPNEKRTSNAREFLKTDYAKY